MPISHLSMDAMIVSSSVNPVVTYACKEVARNVNLATLLIRNPSDARQSAKMVIAQKLKFAKTPCRLFSICAKNATFFVLANVFLAFMEYARYVRLVID